MTIRIVAALALMLGLSGPVGAAPKRPPPPGSWPPVAAVGAAGIAVTATPCCEKSATTDGNGVATFTGLTPGDYQLWFTGSTGRYVTKTSGGGGVAATTGSDGGTPGQKAVLPIRDATPARALLARPVAGLDISAKTLPPSNTLVQAVTTNADGRATFTGLAPAWYMLWFTGSTVRWTVYLAGGGAANANTSGSYGPLNGQVGMQIKNATPVVVEVAISYSGAGVAVTAKPPGTVTTVTTDANGDAKFPALPLGAYNLTFNSADKVLLRIGTGVPQTVLAGPATISTRAAASGGLTVKIQKAP